MAHSIKRKVLYLLLIPFAHSAERNYQKVNNSIQIRKELNTRLITKQAAKLEELEAKRERMATRIAQVEFKIIEQKEKIAQYYRKQGLNI